MSVRGRSASGPQEERTPLKRKRNSVELPGPRPAGTYQRTKAPNACLVCRQRKTRCDNELPVCGFCRASGGDCQYDKPKELRYDQASIAILQRLESLESNLGSLIRGEASGFEAGRCEAGKGPPQREVRHTPGGTGPEATTPSNHHGPDEDESESPPNSAALLRASADMSIESMLKWPLFRDHLKSPEDAAIPRLTGFDGTEELDSPESHLQLQAHTVIPLVENFVVNTLPSSPIMDPELLRHKVSLVIDGGLGWDGDSCLVLLVLALGSISYSGGHLRSTTKIDISKHDEEFKAAECYFWASQRRIGFHHHHNHYLAAQLSFFTGVYFGHTMRVMAAWKAFAQAGTQCLAHFVAMGVMDGPAAASPAESADGTVGRRVLQDSLYWAILKGEAELCFELGLPASGLHECGYPHIYPQPPDLSTTPVSSEECMSPEAHTHRHFVTGWFYYLGEIALRRLQNRALHFRYSECRNVVRWNSSTEQWYMEKLETFDCQLRQWLQSLPSSLKFDPSSAAPLHDHLRWVLRVHRTDIIEILRFPAYQALLLSPPDTTLQGLSPASIQITREYLDNAKLRIDLRAEAFLHRHQGSFLTIRNSARSALGLIGAKLKCKEFNETCAKAGKTSPQDELESAIMPLGWEESVDSVIRMLRVWETEDSAIGSLRAVVQNLFRASLGNETAQDPGLRNNGIAMR